MPLYENERNAENRIKVPEEVRNAVVFGTREVAGCFVDAIAALRENLGRTVLISFDGWYAVDWPGIISLISETCKERKISCAVRNIKSVFKPAEDIENYKKPFLSEDPGFGIVNTTGRIEDLFEGNLSGKLVEELAAYKTRTDGEVDALIVYGCGSSAPSVSMLYDLRLYFDTTKQSVLWNMWGGNLVPFGFEGPKKDYWWKEYYYCDFYLLNEQKHFAFKHMDYYVQAIENDALNLVPRKAFDIILSTLAASPTKNVKYAQPGPWGAYRFRDTRWNMPELSNNAWNSLISPNELAMLVDIGREKMLKMPAENLMLYPELFVGPYLHKTFPRLIPLYIWLDDGYFPKPEPAERTSMPIHNHPGTAYVNRHFREPMGRYETYYIAEAYEGANTWMGFTEGADLEKWEALCRESEKNGKPIDNWKDFIGNWETNVGDLFLIPPGTSHGHGGNQMVIEMDTVPSVAGTEYSFFGYDFARGTWDDNAKSMTGKPMKMHLERYFDNEKWRRTNWVRERLRSKPKIVAWTKDYWIDRYASLPEMPFEVERLHFVKKAEYDTGGRFMHMVVLAAGDIVEIRSKTDPAKTCTMEWLQGACIPACFGNYEIINLKEGLCTVVLLRWKKG